MSGINESNVIWLPISTTITFCLDIRNRRTYWTYCQEYRGPKGTINILYITSNIYIREDLKCKIFPSCDKKWVVRGKKHSCSLFFYFLLYLLTLIDIHFYIFVFWSFCLVCFFIFVKFLVLKFLVSFLGVLETILRFFSFCNFYSKIWSHLLQIIFLKSGILLVLFECYLFILILK